MNGSYPIIKIPDFLTKPHLYLDSLENLEEPLEPKEPRLKSNSPWVIIIYTFLGMPLLSVGLGIPGFILAIILFIVILVNNSSSEERRHNAQIKAYQSEILAYKEKLENYHKQLEIKKQREIEIEVMKENPALKILKIWTTRIEYLESTKPPSDKNLEAKKGLTEDFFYNYLKATFNEVIYIDKTLSDYTPDFIYFHPKFKLYIDVEIDEPYDGISKEPTHYFGSDDLRDNYFLRNKWCVIRFSEKQIIEQPKACCDEIKRTVNNILFTVYKPEEISTNLANDKRWTQSEAKKMAMENFRDSYLLKIT